MTHKISLQSVRAIISNRPLGYYQDVISSGRVEGDVLFIEHDSYVALRQKYSPKDQTSFAIPFGPGTELKKLLSKLGLKPALNCQCAKRIREMNQRGCEWCSENIAIILEWLREEAKRAGLPFFEAGARIVVKRAIHNAKRI